MRFPRQGNPTTPTLSVIVACYNMRRELPRTLATLSPRYQNLPADEYEVIVVDNGSTEPLSIDECQLISPNITIRRFDASSKSPALALNTAIANASGSLVGVMIDGARMASPGLLASAMAAAQQDRRTIVASWGFHLGDQVQMEAIHTGYDQRAEDQLLESVDWENDGYALFEISCFAGSSRRNGWASPPNESNAIFMTKETWKELGGFDTRFESPGGGLVNLDLWNRAVELPDHELVMLLGEGTFHQVHGGVATNTTVPRWPEFSAEYKHIVGTPYKVPSPVSVTYLGALDTRAQEAFRISIQRWATSSHGNQ